MTREEKHWIIVYSGVKRRGMLKTRQHNNYYPDERSSEMHVGMGCICCLSITNNLTWRDGLTEHVNRRKKTVLQHARKIVFFPNGL